MAGVKSYLAKITSQYADKPKFMDWLKSLLEPIDHTHALLEEMHASFDVNTATGDQQNILGEIVGIGREVTSEFINADSSQFDDETMRRLIRTKIIANQWDGRQGTIEQVWSEATNDTLSAIYHDNQDMTITVDLEGDYRPIDVELVLRGFIVPKPMGVALLTRMRTRTDAKAMVRARTGYVGTVSFTGLHAN